MASVNDRKKSFETRLLPAAGVALLTLSLAILAADNLAASQEQVLSQTEQSLRAEYRDCTGDTSVLLLSQLLRWKQAYHDQAQSAGYKALLAQYLVATGRPGDIRPCEVLAWQARRQEELNLQDQELSRKILSAADSVLDSLSMQRQLTENPPSAFDFDRIAFGLSQPSVKFLFNRRMHRPLSYEYPYLYCRNVEMAGSRFTVAFHFDLFGRLYKYELESPDAPADSLDSAVRPLARALQDHFRDKLGAPAHTAAVGRHDISTGRLARTAHWNEDSTSADVGIGVYNNRYYAKAIVTRQLRAPVRSAPPAAPSIRPAPDSTTDTTPAPKPR
jgi:hypothetical protein